MKQNIEKTMEFGLTCGVYTNIQSHQGFREGWNPVLAVFKGTMFSRSVFEEFHVCMA